MILLASLRRTEIVICCLGSVVFRASTSLRTNDGLASDAVTISPACIPAAAAGVPSPTTSPAQPVLLAGGSSARRPNSLAVVQIAGIFGSSIDPFDGGPGLVERHQYS